MSTPPLKAPFPYFGGKASVAAAVWDRFGAVRNYVEPFAGSLAVLLGRPQPFEGSETVNDADGLVSNFWRALGADPTAVATAADWPVNEVDLMARHAWLVGHRDDITTRLEGDPEWFDARAAGWWAWGLSCWIGSGFCSGRGGWGVVEAEDGTRQMGRLDPGTPGVKRAIVSLGGSRGVVCLQGEAAAEAEEPAEGEAEPEGVKRKIVHLGSAGQGVHRQVVNLGNGGRGVNRQIVHLRNQGMGINRKMVHVGNSGQGVNRKLVHFGDAGRGVNRQLVSLGDGGRGVNRPAPDPWDQAEGRLYAYFAALADRLRGVRVCCGDFDRVLGPSVTTKHGVTAVFLDPPYGDEAGRMAGIYATDSGTVADRARAWACEHGADPLLRIALCGYEGEHGMPEGWKCHEWKARGGYGSQGDGRGRANSRRERVWFSPACLDPEGDRLPMYAIWDAAR